MEQSEETKELYIPEEQLWENLKISNDFMFAKVMRNPELCKGMLERLLDIVIDVHLIRLEKGYGDIHSRMYAGRMQIYF